MSKLKQENDELRQQLFEQSKRLASAAKQAGAAAGVAAVGKENARRAVAKA